jgi:multidrug resistance efflux pump
MKKKRSTGNHVSRQYYLRHLLPVVVWLVAVGVVVWLFHQRSERFQVIGIAQGQVRQVATNCAGRVKDVSVRLYDDVSEGQVVAVVDTVLDNEYDEDVLRAQLATISARIEQLVAQLVPTQDDLQASREDREAARISDMRRFVLDVDNARLRVLELKAQLAGDQMLLGDLMAEAKIIQDLVEKKAVAPYELEQIKTRQESLTQSMAERVHLLEEAEARVASAQKRLDEYAERETFHPSVESALEPTRKEIGVQERLMQEISVRLAALEQRRVLELASPVDGVVSQIWRAPGEAVTAGDPILTIAVSRPTEVIGYARQGQMGQVRENMEVQIAKASDPLQVATSRVTYVGPAVEQMPAQLWQNPTVPQYGRPFKVQLPPELAVIPGEVVGIRGL